MPIKSESLKLYYYDVPKIACTSLKTLFRNLDVAKRDRVQHKLKSNVARVVNRFGLIKLPVAPSIHQIPGYQAKSWKVAAPPPGGYETLVVLRDPVSRIHSAWKNKVKQSVFSTRDELEDLANDGLSPNPDFGTFIDFFEQYRIISRAARVHTYPYSWHLGEDLDFFDHVFKLEEFEGLISFLSEKAGIELTVPYKNRSERDGRDDRLNPGQIEKLRLITAGEYKWTKGLYSFDSGLEAVFQ